MSFVVVVLAIHFNRNLLNMTHMMHFDSAANSLALFDTSGVRQRTLLIICRSAHLSTHFFSVTVKLRSDDSVDVR